MEGGKCNVKSAAKQGGRWIVAEAKQGKKWEYGGGRWEYGGGGRKVRGERWDVESG